MLSGKNYLQILFIVLGLIVLSTFSYAYYYAKSNAKSYPLPLMNRISFDAKLKFIRENIDTNEVDTLIVGSSLALNNVQGIVIEDESKVVKDVLNLSMWSIGALQVEQLLELSDAFPNLKRIVYSGQFSDFGNKLVFKNYDSDVLQDYMASKLNPIAHSTLLLDACKDIAFCKKREKEWKNPKYHTHKNFHFLNFDHTGSAPIVIRGKDRIQRRWESPHAPVQIAEAFEALRRIAKKAKSDGIQFYFIQQPYRQPLIDKNKGVKHVMQKFATGVKELVNNEGGYFLSLHYLLKLDDTHFADRSHLNANGSQKGSKEIAKFIDKHEGVK
ncbi:MAG: hypothetical protein U9N11_02250 [Campylobacterota bacterium]|nr:hypothetical protein [Campylobacterota bacterium]